MIRPIGRQCIQIGVNHPMSASREQEHVWLCSLHCSPRPCHMSDVCSVEHSIVGQNIHTHTHKMPVVAWYIHANDFAKLANHVYRRRHRAWTTPIKLYESRVVCRGIDEHRQIFLISHHDGQLTAARLQHVIIVSSVAAEILRQARWTHTKFERIRTKKSCTKQTDKRETPHKESSGYWIKYLQQL